MRAILYAAGCAHRLGPVYSKRPKILLEFGGKSLLEWHAKRLASLGIRDVVVVTGFERQAIAGAMEELRHRYSVELREIFNPDFQEGSVLSFYASLPELRGRRRPVLIMDGDVLYPTALLERLVGSRHRSALLIDRAYTTADDDPVIVPVRDGRPFDLVKCWSGEAQATGESIGFFKVDPDDVPALVLETEKRTRGPARQEPYEEILRAMVRDGRFQFEDVTGIPWIEIDFPEDVETAAKEVFPAIQRFEEGPAAKGR